MNGTTPTISQGGAVSEVRAATGGHRWPPHSAREVARNIHRRPLPGLGIRWIVALTVTTPAGPRDITVGTLSATGRRRTGPYRFAPEIGGLPAFEVPAAEAGKPAGATRWRFARRFLARRLRDIIRDGRLPSGPADAPPGSLFGPPARGSAG